MSAIKTVYCCKCGRQSDRGCVQICRACSGMDTPKPKTERLRPTCQFCGEPAVCYGHSSDTEPGYACDKCCGHGCEDGECEFIPTPAAPSGSETEDAT